MLEWLRSRQTARRMGLRDKGAVAWFGDPNDKQVKTLVCNFCKTRLRIGIDDMEKVFVRYCWRCEVEVNTSSHDDNGGNDDGDKKPLPEETQKLAQCVGSDVLSFEKYKKSNPSETKR